MLTCKYDALVVINAHQPLMLGRIVTLGRTGGNQYGLNRRLGRPGGGYHEQTGDGTAHSQ